jgi:hypothetical protein
MKKLFFPFFIYVFFLNSLIVLAQSLEQNQYLLSSANVSTEFSEIQKQNLKKQLFENQYYLYFQFKETPTQVLLKKLAKQGVALLNYVGNKTYWVVVSSSFFFQNMGE